jgi:hypothetical protein
MPREDYAAPAVYALSYLSRVVRLLVYGALGLGVTAYASFEGLHMYIENVCMATPSRGSDEYGWQEENQGWTGGEKGGTDPRLGWRARHALRGAWICQEWGAGGSRASIGRSVHPEFRGMIGAKINKIDQGYELAEEYIDLAIAEAKKRGIIFPSAPTSSPPNPTNLVDPTAVDLLLLKAGVLERMATPQTLHQARDIYEQVLAASGGKKARVMRLAGKIGDISLRTGDDGMPWWTLGLEQVGVQLPAVEEGWFKSSKPEPVAITSPPLIRATISLLISTEAHLATSSQLKQAAAVQDLATSLIPTPTPSSPSTALHDLWLSHRAALLMFHRANVHHALGQPALELVATASRQAESLLPIIPSYPTSDPLSQPARILQREATSLAAESAYTRGLLSKSHLETAAECFERAMSLTDEGSPEWERYYRSFARVRERMEATTSAPV